MKKSLPAVLITLLLCHLTTQAAEITYTDRDIIRNGEFAGEDFWYAHLSTEISGGSLRFCSIVYDRDDTFAFHQLLLPSVLNSATLTFRYSTEENTGTGGPSRFTVSIGSSIGFDTDAVRSSGDATLPLSHLVTLYEETIDRLFDWRQQTVHFGAAALTAIQNAHDRGEMVFLTLSYDRITQEHEDNLLIDNISLTVNGTQHVPSMGGKIAYIKEDKDKAPHSISILDPSTGASQTIWSHPDKTIFHWEDVAWRPDGTELAFISDHEFLASPFLADIFAMKPDGSGIRKITSSPSLGEIRQGNHPRVTVRGQLTNIGDDTSIDGNFLILGLQYVEGGTAIVANVGETVPFEINNVPLLDNPVTYSGFMSLYYANTGCNMGLEHRTVNGMVRNGVVDVGTINFIGATCFSYGYYIPRELTWKRDGSEIAFRFEDLQKLPSTSSRSFPTTDIEPGGGALASNMSWSPVDNRYLFIDYNYPKGDQLFLAVEGGTEQLLIDKDVIDAQPVWLPDGSGFLYLEEDRVDEGIIMHYDLATGNKQRLTWFKNAKINDLAISPDGRYILFEWHDQIIHTTSDFWIMDRLNPVDMWQVTNTGNCRHPDWSRTEVTIPEPTPQPPAPPAPPGVYNSGHVPAINLLLREQLYPPP